MELFAYGLRDLGVRRGDRVALHSENSTEWLIADQAILSQDAATAQIYTTQPADQIQYILQDSEAVAYIVSSQKLFAPVADVPGRLPALKVVIGIRGAFAEGMVTWQDVLARGEKARRPTGLLRAARAGRSRRTWRRSSTPRGPRGRPRG